MIKFSITDQSKLILIIIVTFLFASSSKAQYSIYEKLDIDEVEYSITDFGTMWTFDDIPLDYFESTYGFRLTEEWLDHVQKSALQFGRGCSAAFVSGDGLIMTNHHCGRGQLSSVQEEGENLLRDGFYAVTPEEERQITGLYVDQLLSIVDVTGDVMNAMNFGETDEEKVVLKDVKISELTTACEEESGNKCRVVSLYNGGKYSLYEYKRYKDVRLVMTPDFQIAATGWDWDNFTYPRYELDFAFYRAYDEDGKPAKSDNYYKWSDKGAEENEPIFVIGRPGNTDRLSSVAQLEYFRDKVYPNMLLYYNEVYKVNFEIFNKYPERESELLHKVLSTGNRRKSYAARLMGLNDPYLMQKKKDFENKLIEKVEANSELEEKYGHLWDALQSTIDELRSTADESYAYKTNFRSSPVFFRVASKVIEYAEQMKLPQEERLESYTDENLEMTVSNIFPASFDQELQTSLVGAHANYISGILGDDNELSKRIYAGFKGKEAVDYVLQNSSLISQDKFDKLITMDPEEIFSVNDPFIKFVLFTREKLDDIVKIRSEAANTLEVLNQQLGKLIFEVYGNKISPDATSSLRISDGVIKGYEYNGTIAPGKTTYYGLWDRYNSFNKNTYPWGLHERWKKPPAELDLSIPIGFASTNDIVGGNSGSSVINRNGEIVGLVHDGNLESLAGHFAFLPENNRTVATDSRGLIEALKYVYKTDKLVEELLTGKISD